MFTSLLGPNACTFNLAMLGFLLIAFNNALNVNSKLVLISRLCNCEFACNRLTIVSMRKKFGMTFHVQTYKYSKCGKCTFTNALFATTQFNMAKWHRFGNQSTKFDKLFLKKQHRLDRTVWTFLNGFSNDLLGNALLPRNAMSVSVSAHYWLT